MIYQSKGPRVKTLIGDHLPLIISSQSSSVWQFKKGYFESPTNSVLLITKIKIMFKETGEDLSQQTAKYFFVIVFVEKKATTNTDFSYDRPFSPATTPRLILPLAFLPRQWSIIFREKATRQTYKLSEVFQNKLHGELQ